MVVLVLDYLDQQGLPYFVRIDADPNNIDPYLVAVGHMLELVQ